MRVLMVSLDDSVFRPTPSSNTRSRLLRYLHALQKYESHSTITALIFTSQPYQPLELQEGLRLLPVKCPRVQWFPILGLLAAWQSRERLQPEVITAQNAREAGLLGTMLAHYFQVPLEVQVHTHLLSTYWQAQRPIFNRARLALAKWILKRAQSIRVVSSPVKQQMISQWGIPAKQVAVIPVPVFYEHQETDEETSRSPTPAHQTVLFVGRLSVAKNLPGLFYVITKVLSNHKEVQFILIGDGEQRAHVRAQINQLEPLCKKRIHLLGQIPYSEIPRYYQQANLLILPSLYEGFGRVLMEAYLFGTPAVATRCGGPEDIIVHEETGFLTDIEAMDDFADRILWLLAHPQDAEQMGTRGKSYVQQTFNPDRLIRQMVKQWHDLSRNEYKA